MQICTECGTIEGGTIYKELEDGSEVEACSECGCDEDGCIKHYDEDYGKDR